MRNRTVRFLAFFAAFAFLTGGECNIGSLGDILEEPGQIVVTNTGSDVAVISIVASDVKSYPTLASGGTASAQTNVGGQYHVSVVMTPENAAAYRTSLLSLRQLVEQQIAGTAPVDQKTQLFINLAGIKAAIQALENQTGAGCSGVIELNQEFSAAVNATVRWEPQGGAGFWDVTCGSNSGS